jgi:hypothetical protein
MAFFLQDENPLRCRTVKVNLFYLVSGALDGIPSGASFFNAKYIRNFIFIVFLIS